MIEEIEHKYGKCDDCGTTSKLTLIDGKWLCFNCDMETVDEPDQLEERDRVSEEDFE